LILLDLNMPGNNGFDILRKIRALERISAIPVVVLSTSGSPGDIADAYRLGADAYVVKSDRFDQYVKLVGTLVSYWLDTVALPPAVGAGS